MLKEDLIFQLLRQMVESLNYKIIELILDMGNNALKVAQCHTEPHTDQRRPLQGIFAKSAHLNVCIDECYEGLNSRGSQQWDVV